MATCAACRQPLLTDQRAKIVGHEVLHAACVGRQTVNQHLAERLHRMEPRIAALEATATAQHGEVTRMRLEQGRLQAELDRANIARDQALAAATTAMTQRDAALSQVTTLTQERARSDATKQVTATPDAPDARDAMEIRFALLEYD